MFKTLELPGALPPWPAYQGFAMDPLGALSSPQTPRPMILHPPPFLIPGYGPERTTLGQDRKDEVLSFSMFGIYNKNL